MNNQEIRKKLLAAYDLLQGETTTLAKLKSIRTLIKGINPRIDAILDRISKAHSDLSMLSQGEIIELTAENLPENNEREKKRKKAILLFIKNWKELKGEIERVRGELEKEGPSSQEKASNILAGAKGPLALITIAAVIIVAGIAIVNSSKGTPTKETQETKPAPNQAVQKIKVIDFNGKKIPLSELTTGIGPECQTNQNSAEHYHALDHKSAKSIDGSSVSDPGGCGFGKVSDTQIEEI